jgi:hypothetical protein
MMTVMEANMDEKTYARWWEYHIRAVKGETLTAEEQAEYEVGLTALDQEEKEQFQANDLTALRQSRAKIEQLQADHARLMAEHERLDKRIALLERNYQTLTGYPLLTESYVAS